MKIQKQDGRNVEDQLTRAIAGLDPRGTDEQISRAMNIVHRFFLAQKNNKNCTTESLIQGAYQTHP